MEDGLCKISLCQDINSIMTTYEPSSLLLAYVRKWLILVILFISNYQFQSPNIPTSQSPWSTLQCLIIVLICGARNRVESTTLALHTHRNRSLTYPPTSREAPPPSRDTPLPTSRVDEVAFTRNHGDQSLSLRTSVKCVHTKTFIHTLKKRDRTKPGFLVYKMIDARSSRETLHYGRHYFVSCSWSFVH